MPFHRWEDDDGGNGRRRGDAPGDSDESEEEAVGARPTALQRAALETGARHLRRGNQEKRWMIAGEARHLPFQFGYLVELYGSRRFKHLDAAHRYATCVQVLHHYAEHLDESGAATISGVGTPPFVRRSHRHRAGQRFRATVRPLSVCKGDEGSGEVEGGDSCKHTPVCRRVHVVPSAGLVPSRGRRGGDDEGDDDVRRSPAGDLCPGRVQGSGLPAISTLPDEAAFYDEVVALLACVLRQYDEVREVRSRVRREQLLLSFALGRDQDGNATRQCMDGDERLWWQNLQRVILSPHLTVGVLANTDAFNDLCGRILQVRPGEQLERQVHGLESLDEVRARHQAPYYIAEKLWGLQAEGRYTLGRIPRPPSSDRAEAVARRRRRARRGAGPEAGGRSSDGEVSSASDTEARVTRPAQASRPARRDHSYLPRARHWGAADADADADGTQPTQGLAALLGAAAASDPATSSCTYCNQGVDVAAGEGGALWRCQLCARSYCHSACCADVAAAAFGASHPPEHVCTVCASQELRSRGFVERGVQSAVIRALRVVVHPTPLAIRLRDRQLGPALLLAVQRAVGQLVDAAHARALLRGETRAEADAYRIVLGGLRGLAMLQREPLAALEAVSTLLKRLQARLARLAVPHEEEDEDDEDDNMRGVCPGAVARATVDGLSTAVRIVDEGGEEESDEGGGDGGGGGGEAAVPVALCGGRLRPDAREELKAALAAVVSAAVVEAGLLRWVEGHLAPLLPLRRTQVASAFADRANGGGRAVGEDDGSGLRDGDAGDGEAEPCQAVGAVGGPVSTRRTHEYRRRLSIYPLVELRMIGNTHVAPLGSNTRTTGAAMCPLLTPRTNPRQAMNHWKQLRRLVSFFGREPRSLRRRIKRLGWAQASGVAEDWLDARANEYDSPAHLAAKLERYRGYFEQQSSDNASVYSSMSMTLGQRARQALSHYTAHGSNFWHPACGWSRAGPGAPLPTRVAQWIVPSSTGTSWACHAVADLEPGAPCTFPPDGPRLPPRLPWAAYAAARDQFVVFDGTVYDAARLVPGYVNLCDNVASPLTGVPERANLTKWHAEVHRLDLCTAVHSHAALLWCSSPCLPIRPVHMLHMEDGNVVTFKGGLRAHSKQIYRHRWDDDLQSLRRTEIHSGVPLPLNSLSKTDALYISLYMCEKAIVREGHPGWYNKHATGDEGRTFFGGDLGSENVIFSNLEDTLKRIWAAALQPSDPDYGTNYKPFLSAAQASRHVGVASRLLVNDHLPCAMHNDFTILKSLCIAHESIASLNEVRLLLNMPLLQWDKEGKQFRQKKTCMNVLRQARYCVALERFHTQPAVGTSSAPWVDSVSVQGGFGLYGQYAGGDTCYTGFPGFDEDHYMKRYGDMIEDSNRDGEMLLLNQLQYDLMTSFRVDQLARSHGLSELKQLQRKFWPAWLAQAGAKGHFHVIHHQVRQLLAPFARSGRQSMAAFMNAVLSLSGEFGHDVDNDEVQELLVLVVKKFLSDVRPSSSPEAVHRAVRRVAAALHLPMHVIPQLERLWGVLRGRQYSARRRNGSTRDRVQRVARRLRRTELVPDPGRVAIAGELGELGRMERSVKLEVRTTGEALGLAVFHYPHLTGSPPVLTRSATLVASLEKPIWVDGGQDEAGSEQDDAFSDAGSASAGEANETAKAIQSAIVQTGAEGLQAGQQWVGTEYSRYKSGRELDAVVDSESGRFRGYLRNRWHRATKSYLPSVAHRDQVTVALLATLSLLPCAGGPWLLCTWAGASTGRDPSTSWLLQLLPESCLIVRLGGKDASRAADPKQALVDALRDDTCYLSKAVTVMHVVKEAHRFAPLLRSGGVAAQRSSKGARKIPRASRRGRRAVPRRSWVRYVAASSPPTLDGLDENLCVYMYNGSAPRAVDASVKRVGKEANSGLEVLRQWRSESGVSTDAFAMAEAVQGTVARQSEAVSGAPPTAARPALRVPLQASAFPKPWDSVLASRLSSGVARGPCGGVNGDNLKVRPVASALAKLRGVHKYMNAACNVIQSAQLQGGSYSFEWLAGQRSGDGGSVGGGGGPAAGSSGVETGGAGRSSEQSKADDEVERLESELAQASRSCDNEAQYVYAALARNDGDAHAAHAAQWAELATHRKGLRRALLRADSRRSRLVEEATARPRASAPHVHAGAHQPVPPVDAGPAATEEGEEEGGEEEDDEPYENPSSSEDEALEWLSDDGATSSSDSDAPREDSGSCGSE